MNWLYLVAFASIVPFYSMHAAEIEKEAEYVSSKVKQYASSIEERITKYEEELGIKQPPQKTHFILFGEFLYWKASLDGVAWATTGVVVPNPAGGTTFNHFKTRAAHFEYSPGFHVGAGVALPYDQWDVEVMWLRSYSTGRDLAHGRDKQILGNDGLLVPLSSVPSRASAECQVHLDIVDLGLGRIFLWSTYFSIRPFAGVRATWLKLDWDISFKGPSGSTHLDIDNHFDAVGLVGGFESTWDFYKGLGLFSYASASLVYGESSEETKQKFLGQTFNAKNSAHAVKSIFDIAVGLKWENKFFKKTHLSIHAGYNFFYWPAVTQKTVVQSSRIRDRADLSFQGLVAGGSLKF
jgi:hypothetical protein